MMTTSSLYPNSFPYSQLSIPLKNKQPLHPIDPIENKILNEMSINIEKDEIYDYLSLESQVKITASTLNFFSKTNLSISLK